MLAGKRAEDSWNSSRTEKIRKKEKEPRKILKRKSGSEKSTKRSTRRRAGER